ncbi:MAG: helix-turn-helix domain-containing protein [Clostridia bacterium]|nr:helix-turn-helix domain-containing protein [Clostridia bacterium]
MNCEDLLNIKEIRSGIKLVAGEVGIHRNVRWIYFADCMQCLDEGIDPAELIHGEELVIITNKSLTDYDDKITDMIKSMFPKNIAALVINEGQISENIIKYCNDVELPLYELSVNLHLIDFTQIICKVLVEEESKINSRERILTSILYSEQPDTDDIVKQANYLGVNLSGPYRIAIMKICNKMSGEYSDEGYLIEMRRNIKKQVENEFRLHGLGKMLIHSQINHIVVMFPSELFSKDLVISIFNNIIKKVHSRYNVVIKTGIGSAYEYIEELKNSYREANNTLQIIKIAENEENVYFYEDIGIYSIISQVKNGKFLDDYAASRIGKLIEADIIQEGELLKTLETYINCNCNANAAAEILYIHRNTMRYRLDKIKKILGSNINDLSVCLELKLAIIIKKFRDNRIE